MEAGSLFQLWMRYVFVKYFSAFLLLIEDSEVGVYKYLSFDIFHFCLIVAVRLDFLHLIFWNTTPVDVILPA